MEKMKAIASMYAAGNSLSLTAEHFGVGISVVRRALRQTGTAARSRGDGQKYGKRRAYGQTAGRPCYGNRKVDYERVKARYLAGESLNQISVALGVSDETVRRALKASGVERRARGTHSERFVGNERIRVDGYVEVRVGKGSRRLKHRLIAEKALGRPLRSGEVVHHINCDRADNRPENLLICSAKYHRALHARMRKHPYWSKFDNSQGD